MKAKIQAKAEAGGRVNSARETACLRDALDLGSDSDVILTEEEGVTGWETVSFTVTGKARKGSVKDNVWMRGVVDGLGEKAREWLEVGTIRVVGGKVVDAGKEGEDGKGEGTDIPPTDEGAEEEDLTDEVWTPPMPKVPMNGKDARGKPLEPMPKGVDWDEEKTDLEQREGWRWWMTIGRRRARDLEMEAEEREARRKRIRGKRDGYLYGACDEYDDECC